VKAVYRASDLNSRFLLHKVSYQDGGSYLAKVNIKDNIVYLELLERVIAGHDANLDGRRGDYHVDSIDAAKQCFDYKLLSDATCTTMGSFLRLVNEQLLHASIN
jgi:hypothetical protein